MKGLLKMAAILCGVSACPGADFDCSVPVKCQSVIKRIINRYANKMPQGTSLFFSVAPALPPETFEIEAKSNSIRITGGSQRSVIYGLGQLLRENNFVGKSSPQFPERGIYFATHFSNFYDNSDAEVISDYIADLALWGCNGVSVWFDMHHYTEIKTPGAQQKIAQLKNILQAAKDCGLSAGLLGIANESFDGSEVHLRADHRGGKNNYRNNLAGHFNVEICPSVPGGLAKIMECREAVLSEFADVKIDFVTIFPYDQGGCTCSDCAPYGNNGMWKIIPHYAKLAKKYFGESCKVELSCWRFDAFTDGEWDGIFARDLTGIDRIYIDPADLDKVKNTSPGGLPVVYMSEISMIKMLPWGGFGANPLPQQLAKELETGIHCAGARPYSEGIFEDFNKVLILSWLWQQQEAKAIADRYAKFYFDIVDDRFYQAITLLENNLDHNARFYQDGAKFSSYSGEKLKNAPFEIVYETPALSAEAAQKAFKYLQEIAPEKISWRWEILALRAEIDAKLAQGESLDSELQRLYQLYNVSDSTISCLVPPGKKIFQNKAAKGISGHI